MCWSIRKPNYSLVSHPSKKNTYDTNPNPKINLPRWMLPRRLLVPVVTSSSSSTFWWSHVVVRCFYHPLLSKQVLFIHSYHSMERIISSPFFFLVNIQKTCLTWRWERGLWANLQATVERGSLTGHSSPLISRHTRNTVCARARLCLYAVQITVGGSVPSVGLQNFQHTFVYVHCCLACRCTGGKHSRGEHNRGVHSYCVWSN